MLDAGYFPAVLAFVGFASLMAHAGRRRPPIFGACAFPKGLLGLTAHPSRLLERHTARKYTTQCDGRDVVHRGVAIHDSALPHLAEVEV
jgi:hypothetical protein